METSLLSMVPKELLELKKTNESMKAERHCSAFIVEFVQQFELYEPLV